MNYFMVACAAMVIVITIMLAAWIHIMITGLRTRKRMEDRAAMVNIAGPEQSADVIARCPKCRHGIYIYTCEAGWVCGNCNKFISMPLRPYDCGNMISTKSEF
jgi:predicted RNA-binding Zn-ribbon protein involved in translation (DUF1610 family)